MQTLNKMRDEHVFSHLSVLERLRHVFSSDLYESVAGLEWSKAFEALVIAYQLAGIFCQLPTSSSVGWNDDDAET